MNAPTASVTGSALLIFTSLPDRSVAEALARDLLTARLAACVQIGASVQSLYHWRGEIETAEETPVAVKTRSELYARVQEAIRQRHPYELPEIVAVPITDGSPAYLDWIAAETASAAT
jgi:periplasmic divalent cation tolerance protein